MSPASTKLMPVQPFNLEDELNRCPDLKREHIKTLREWLDKQPHLPKFKDDHYLLLFLRACNCSIERTKVTMDNFFTFRTLVPEMSIGRTTDQTDVQRALNTMEIVTLQQRDREGNVILIQKLRDPDVSKYDPNAFMKASTMVVEAFLYEHGPVSGGILICDQQGFGLSHMARIPLGTAKKLFYYLQECIAIQMKRIHIVNPNQYLEKILIFFKTFMNKQLANSIVVHKAGYFEDLHKEVPREILPPDYGGFGKTLAELHDEGVARLSQFNDVFIETDKMVADESKRAEKSRNSEALFGMEGSFKKLEID